MKDEKWMQEKSALKLMLKLHEEVGEITHAFMRGQTNQVLTECDDAALILKRLTTVVALDGLDAITYG